MPESTNFVVAVQSLVDHCQTLLDAHPTEDLDTLRNVQQILYSYLFQLQQTTEEESDD